MVSENFLSQAERRSRRKPHAEKRDGATGSEGGGDDGAAVVEVPGLRALDRDPRASE